MESNEIKSLIRRELPEIVRTDPEIREFVLNLTRERFADKEETESRFDRVLAEIQKDREESSRRWDKQRAEDRRKWDEQKQLWAENQRAWEEQRTEDRRKWDENQKEINRLYKRIDSGIGALGARWGIQSESAFRNGLKAILEESFGVEVINYQDYDEEGAVFGRPDQIELDIIIKNGLLILCEIKSSLSRSDMYIFTRKADFYEEKHSRKADRRLVISPMVENKARQVAGSLGVEVYSYADELPGIE